MERKSNEATPKRPEGDRLLNAPLVEMDLNKFIEQIKGEPTWDESDHNSITIYKSTSLTIVLMGFHANAELKTHKANGTISVQVVSGKIKFTAEPEVVTLAAGQMVVLQEKVLHSVLALEESFVLLTLVME